MGRFRWLVFLGVTTASAASASCTRVEAAAQTPSADAISWSDCKQHMHSARITAHTCEEYSWVRFPRTLEEHDSVVAEASARGGEHGWRAESRDLAPSFVDGAHDVSVIVFRAREADTVIKVSLVATLADDASPTGHAVMVCSREYDAYQERPPEPAAAVEVVSQVCRDGRGHLAGI